MDEFSGHLRPVLIADLIPTQITVGMREVDFERRRWRERYSQDAASYLSNHSTPVILGPRARHIDRHHLTRALHEEGVAEILTVVVGDLSAMSFDEFWPALEGQGYTHPFDDKGNRLSYGDMPQSVFDLTDDPYRSLSSTLKRLGGYAKNGTPFSEGGFSPPPHCTRNSRTRFRPCAGIGAGSGPGP